MKDLVKEIKRILYDLESTRKYHDTPDCEVCKENKLYTEGQIGILKQLLKFVEEE